MNVIEREYEYRIFWYALLITICRDDITPDDALRMMDVSKVGTYVRKKDRNL